MTKVDRKAALRAYKERKVVAGIYAVRCEASGGRWVGSAPDLSTVENRLWFDLRLGSFRHRGLQAAWREHGAEALRYEEVERITDEFDPYFRDRLLKDRLAHWAGTLDALPL
jgi:hypothetical protein